MSKPYGLQLRQNIQALFVKSLKNKKIKINDKEVVKDLVLILLFKEITSIYFIEV